MSSSSVVSLERSDPAEYARLANQTMGDGRFSCDFKGNAISASIEKVEHADFQMTRIATQAHEVRRDPRGGGAAHPFLMFMFAGGCRVAQNGVAMQLPPGGFALFDARRPIRASFEARVDVGVIQFSGLRRLRDLIDCFQPCLFAMRGDAGLGRATSNLLRVMMEEVGSLREEAMRDARMLMTDSLRACVMDHLGSAQVSQPRHRRIRFSQIQGYIEERLYCTELTTQAVAEENGVSPRYLSLLFEAEGVSVASYIWTRRLERCRDDLIDHRQSARSITEIAHHWGFKCSAHFSRSFKKRFDFTPSEYRRRFASAAPACAEPAARQRQSCLPDAAGAPLPAS